MTNQEKMIWQLNKIIQESELIRELLVTNKKDSNKIIIREKERLDMDYKYFHALYTVWHDNLK